MRHLSYQTALAGVLLVVVALTLRLPSLGTFMTADEENWMLRSSEFWHKLFRQGDPSGTFLTTHPGVVTMWLAGAGIQWQEVRLGYDIDTSNIAAFRAAALYPMVIANAALIGIVAVLTVPLLGMPAAILAGLLLAFEPYLVGMSQVVHVDMLLALCMLCAVLLFIRYQETHSRRLLLWCGVCTGLAFANKLLPALWLVPFFTLASFAKVRRPLVDTLFTAVASVALVVGLGVLFLAAVWPALWSQPDVPRYFGQDTVTIATKEHTMFENAVDVPVSSQSFYLRTVLGRSSLLALLGSLGAVATVLMVIYQMRTTVALGNITRQRVRTLVVLVLYATGFLILITAIAKKGDRYALPALVILPVLAGWVGAAGWEFLQRRNKYAAYTSTAVLALLVAVPWWLWQPYAIAYNNSVFNVRSETQQGWGEGLDAAATWLNARPNAATMYVASWYPTVFRTFFVGKTFDLSSRYDARTAYIVFYRNMHGRGSADVTSDMLRDFAEKEPVHVVSIRGIPYAWIFTTMGLHYFDHHIGELLGDTEVGQTIPITEDTWSTVSIGMSTFSSRDNTKDILLHIRENLNATHDIRTLRVNAREIHDGEYHTFAFEPIPDAKGKTFYVALTSPTSQQGDAITVRFSDSDLLSGQMLLRRRAPKNSETNEQFLRDGDIAYRVNE